MLSRLRRLNHPAQVFFLLLLILILGSLSFTLFLTSPSSPGDNPTHYQTREIYYFEPWNFRLEGIEVSLPQGGMVVPAYRGEKMEGITVKGPGFILAQEEDENIYRRVQGFFLTLDSQELGEIKGENIFVPVEDPDARSEVNAFFKEISGLPVIKTPGPLRFFPPTGGARFAFLAKDNMTGSSPYLFHRYGNQDIHMTALFYLLLSSIVLLTVRMLTLDTHLSRLRQEFLYRKPSWQSLVFIVLLLPLVFILEVNIPLKGTIPYRVTMLYFLLPGLAFFFSWRGFLLAGDLGLNSQNLIRSILTALVVMLVTLFMIEWTVPAKFTPGGQPKTLPFLFFTGFFLPSLAREIFWRGLLQTTVERALGFWSAVGITALLAGLSAFLTRYITSPNLLSYPHVTLEIWLLVPLSAVILGYFYGRTRNIWGTALLHAMFLFLPLYLHF